jgi:DNA-binding beta-propeller fold protein YncE
VSARSAIAFWQYLLAVAALVALASSAALAAREPQSSETPRYKPDYSWPKLPLPKKWALGELGGLYVDAHDHVWIVQRPGTLVPYEKAAALDPPTASCCYPAPPVIELDPAGNVVQAWGGPGQGYDWPTTEHGITVDHKGNVWIGGSATRVGKNGEPPDGMVLKFSHDGKFLMQIGHAGPSKGSRDSTQLSGVADIAVDPSTNEAYVADGYGNHRIIVFDADTGAFKRMWGAYGKPPTDDKVGPYDPAAAPASQFRNVHCVKVARNGLVYVCDRDNDRMQVFKRDGTFVAEYIYGKDTRPPGTVGHIGFSPDRAQSVLAIADLGNFQIRLVRRASGDVLSTFGEFGNYSGQLNRLHQVAFDSKGNLYLAEAAGKRVQKWVIASGALPK